MLALAIPTLICVRKHLLLSILAVTGLSEPFLFQNQSLVLFIISENKEMYVLIKMSLHLVNSLTTSALQMFCLVRTVSMAGAGQVNSISEFIMFNAFFVYCYLSCRPSCEVHVELVVGQVWN